MNEERLRRDLAELADEVTMVDLRERSLRMSRRLGIQRALASSVAVLVVVGAITGAAVAVRPHPDGPAPLPADTPSPPVSVTPNVPVLSSSAVALRAGQLGRIVYGPLDVTDRTVLETDQQTTVPADLWSWQPGVAPSRLLSLPEVAAVANATVSPDGRRIAWVEMDDNGVWGLVVANADGSDKSWMVSQVNHLCLAPTWSPDSRRLLFWENLPDVGPGRYGVLDTATKTVRWWSGDRNRGGCYAAWSADGGTIAMHTSDFTITLYDVTGRKLREVPDHGGFGAWLCFAVVSASPDGSRLAVVRFATGDDGPGKGPGDLPGQNLWANALIDSRTGKEITLPLGGRELLQVFFRADGSMVVRVRSGHGTVLLLIDKAGRPVGEVGEPTELTAMQIVGVTG
ncbi:hypothetical protein C1I95_25975 [Micromonospora craterilacus]|uniref:WD40 repeat domain-containing protein n=1 Tax=Micromonospora craterilacus TaxID=1655439 RepID=A0A2W2ESM8_9ACTN|nr:PD40 domain-containing protein [Micromonospora craterilacus]PZG12357.1 hypothetical protein C1I95_25975 [Micromonospora craterilacus]